MLVRLVIVGLVVFATFDLRYSGLLGPKRRGDSSDEPKAGHRGHRGDTEDTERRLD